MKRKLVIAALLLICFTSLSLKPAMAISTCATKAQGDANCDGTADLTDYFYFVQESNRIRIPPGVSADFNQDGKIDRADRDIIVDKVGTLAQSVIRFSQRILATISNFRI